jgi:preprotein translocase SecF subunit
MFEIFVGVKFRWMDRRRAAYIFSTTCLVISLVSLILHGGPRVSIDFSGGNVLYVGFEGPAKVGEVREAARKAPLESAEVQMAQENTQAIVRFRVAEGDTANQFTKFENAYQAIHPGAKVDMLSLDSVGPKIGKELEGKAAMAILWSLILILIYVAWRFTRVTFGLGAIIALFHDILITMGVLSVLDREVSLTVVAALLTLGGYSINDTIVVFDRVRENMGLARRMSLKDIIDKSVNQTLSRTILTAGTTLLAVLSLFLLGGVVIHDFALVMLVGVIFGTYSSVYVASALALDISNWWNRRKATRAERSPAKATAAR